MEVTFPPAICAYLIIATVTRVKDTPSWKTAGTGEHKKDKSLEIHDKKIIVV